jgi:hypothetical protein
MNGLNKLECLSLACISSFVYGVWVSSEAIHRVKHLKPSLGFAPALLTNIRLGWKGLPGT